MRVVEPAKHLYRLGLVQGCHVVRTVGDAGGQRGNRTYIPFDVSQLRLAVFLVVDKLDLAKSRPVPKT